MINIKNLDSNKIKIDEKSYKNIIIYYIGYVTVKDFSYAKVNSGNPLYLNIHRMNGYIEESNENKYLTLVFTDESKDTFKKYEELWNKIRDLIKSITNNLDIYDKKNIKIKLFSNDDLPLKNVVIGGRSVPQEGYKCYPQVILHECLYK